MARGGGSEAAQTAAVAKPRVLVVDDDAAVRKAIERMLNAAGFEVTAMHDGAAAVHLLTHAKFDAVLTDIMMPGMNGIELLRAVRATDLEVPVLLMTGAPDVKSAALAVQYGACDYIFKPVMPQDLVRAVGRAVDMNRLAKTKLEAMRAFGSIRPEAGDRAGLEVTFDRAMESMWMAYQPIVAAGTGKLVGFEALLRSSEPALPSPIAVLEAAERLDRLGDLGRRIRTKVVEPMQGAPPDALLFVNLHARDLDDPALVSSSAALTTIAPRVILEITERASLDGVKSPKEKIAQLRSLGFRIAIDDLGAGYAGLTSFAQLEPEFVKLDMSLVRDVDQSAVKQKLVRSMCALCADMGITVVAEGIETRAERELCGALGCNLLQGYFLAKPGKAFPQVNWAA
jgi:EAL domain-containing protein (putative c-di-GMP-specific phosphodiesterase class I)/CheY-like chemotaxis protein